MLGSRLNGTFLDASQTYRRPFTFHTSIGRRHRVLYAASYDDMRQLLAFLTEDCCSGNPEICGDLSNLLPACTSETCS